MTTLTESAHAGEGIISEANGFRSRDAGIILSGQNLVAMAALGRVTASGKFVEHDPAASDGSEDCVAILFDAVDASAADANGVILARDFEVDGEMITYITGISSGDKADAIASLKAQGIIVR